jgi:hypothetical protein
MADLYSWFTSYKVLKVNRPFAELSHMEKNQLWWQNNLHLIRKSTLKLAILPSLSISWFNGKEIYFFENAKFYEECKADCK